ncbi:hypothetical protein LINGRAHAP2_LOCUS13227 [Linum grandiflorum]
MYRQQQHRLRPCLKKERRNWRKSTSTQRSWKLDLKTMHQWQRNLHRKWTRRNGGNCKTRSPDYVVFTIQVRSTDYENEGQNIDKYTSIQSSTNFSDILIYEALFLKSSPDSR